MDKFEKHAKESLLAIGKMVKIARISKDLTQDQLSKMSGISKPIISSIESGDCNFTIQTLIALSNALNLYIDINLSMKKD